MQASSLRMKKVAYSEWLALQGQGWSSLCSADQANYQVEGRSHVSSTHEDEAEAPDRNLVMSVNMEQCLFGLADQRSPLRTTEFMAAVRRELQVGEAAGIGGFTNMRRSCVRDYATLCSWQIEIPTQDVLHRKHELQ